jgi:hypothetical protein
MSGHGRGHQVNGWLCDAMNTRRIASPDRAGAITEFSHTRRPPHGYVVDRQLCLVRRIIRAVARSMVSRRASGVR